MNSEWMSDRYDTLPIIADAEHWTIYFNEAVPEKRFAANSYGNFRGWFPNIELLMQEVPEYLKKAIFKQLCDWKANKNQISWSF